MTADETSSTDMTQLLSKCTSEDFKPNEIKVELFNPTESKYVHGA